MISSKIKIAYLVSSLIKQGPVQVLFDIISNLDFDKFEVTVITLKKEDVNSMYTAFKALPVDIKSLETSNKYNLYKKRRELKRFVTKEKIQVIHSHCFRSLILNSLIKTKSFHTIHNYPGLLAKSMNGSIVGTMINMITKCCLKKIGNPIACSQSIANDLSLKDNIHVSCIPNGISLKKEGHLQSQDEYKKKLGLSTDYKYFISVGRFSKEKNFKFLATAFMALNLKSYKLIILGDGVLFSHINELKNDSIILPGFKINVLDYLKASDYYISSSLTEGLPLSVLEAIAVGLPVFLSDIAAHNEILGKQKDSFGSVFNPFSVNDFQLKLMELLQKDYDKLRIKAITSFNQNYTSLIMSKKYQELYIINCQNSDIKYNNS